MTHARRNRAAHRGTTLIEAMAATVVLLFGMLGLLSADLISFQQNSYAVKQNQATALARDVADMVSRWNYTDARLTNVTDNDALVLQSGASLSEPDWTQYELDLGLVSGTPANSPLRAIDNDTFRRHVALRPLMDGTTRLGTLVSAVVSWPEGGRWRQVVLHTMVYDPSGNKAPVPGL
jgi:Tfp pilus assembly protein PilE